MSGENHVTYPVRKPYLTLRRSGKQPNRTVQYRMRAGNLCKTATWRAVILILLLSAAAAQTDLSTPGGQSVLATFTTEPPGAEVYVSGSYVGTSPVTARLNADTPTPYMIRPLGERHKSYGSTVTLGTNGTINIQLVEAASQVQPQVSVSQPRQGGGVPRTDPGTAPAQAAGNTRAFGFATAPFIPYVLAGSAVLLAGLFFALYLRGLRTWRRYPPLRELEREKLRARRELTQLRAEEAGLLRKLERDRELGEQAAEEGRNTLEREIAGLRQTLGELRGEFERERELEEKAEEERRKHARGREGGNS